MRDDLASLVERIEAGSGPDDDLVLAICRYFMPRPDYASLSVPIMYAINRPGLTSAVALVERVLPEAGWQAGRSRDTGLCAGLVVTREPFRGEHSNSAARALLAAALRALASQETLP